MNDLDRPTGASDPAEHDEVESVLQSAVWLAQDLGIVLPPVPDIYAQVIDEVAVGQLYATVPSLLQLSSRAAIAASISEIGWPPSGLAFGYLPRGRNGEWFYTLVGAQQIIHISLRLSWDPDSGIRLSAAFVDAAHARLERYLRDESNYFRSINPLPPQDGVPRRVIAYSDDVDFDPTETHATWVPGAALSDFIPRSEAFAEGATTEAVETEAVVFRP